MDVVTVVAHRLVPAPIEVTWRFLTEAPLVSQWLADVERLAPWEPFRFDFGDGDFFVGQMGEWHRPSAIAFRIKFMNLAPEFRTDYALQPLGRETFVTVREGAATSEAHAAVLQRKWDDLLSRLEARVRSGNAARRPWMETIAPIVRVNADAAEIVDAIKDEEWRHTSFPTARIVVRFPSSNALVLTFEDASAWSGRVTTATLQIERVGDDSVVSVAHCGWGALGQEARQRERRRYAEHWARALERLVNEHSRTSETSG